MPPRTKYHRQFVTKKRKNDNKTKGGTLFDVPPSFIRYAYEIEPCLFQDNIPAVEILLKQAQVAVVDLAVAVQIGGGLDDLRGAAVQAVVSIQRIQVGVARDGGITGYQFRSYNTSGTVSVQPI